jgi:hypothetical protein
MTDQTQDVEANVDENEIVSEASMSDNPKDAEVASVTGVKARPMRLNRLNRLKPKLVWSLD